MPEIVLKTGEKVLIVSSKKEPDITDKVILRRVILKTPYSKEEMDAKTVLDLNRRTAKELEELGYAICWGEPFVIEIRKMDDKEIIKYRTEFVVDELWEDPEELPYYNEQEEKTETNNYTVKIFDKSRVQEVIDSGFNYPRECVSLPFYKRKQDAAYCYENFYTNQYVGVVLEIQKII